MYELRYLVTLNKFFYVFKMAEYAREIILRILPEECYDEFFVKFNFLHVTCLKIALSKMLGIGIIAGSLMVKFPQIMKIFNAKSAQGISFVGVLLETIAITSSVAYSYANNFPFSSWGEGLFLVIQTVMIGFLVLCYGYQKSHAWTFLLTYCATFYLLVSGFTPMVILWLLQASVIPIVVVSKLVQAKANYTNGSTGQLSAVTVFMLFFGSVARIFTSIQETGDLLVVLTYVTTTLGNGLVAGQMLYYWNVAGTDHKVKKGQAGKNAKKNKKKAT